MSFIDAEKRLMSASKSPTPRNWAAKCFGVGIVIQALCILSLPMLGGIGMGMAQRGESTELTLLTLLLYLLLGGALWVPLALYVTGIGLGLHRVFRFEGSPRHIGCFFVAINLLTALGTGALIAKWFIG
jgi:hypothetical protein